MESALPIRAVLDAGLPPPDTQLVAVRGWKLARSSLPGRSFNRPVLTDGEEDARPPAPGRTALRPGSAAELLPQSASGKSGGWPGGTGWFR